MDSLLASLPDFSRFGRTALEPEDADLDEVMREERARADRLLRRPTVILLAISSREGQGAEAARTISARRRRPC